MPPKKGRNCAKRPHKAPPGNARGLWDRNETRVIRCKVCCDMPWCRSPDRPKEARTNRNACPGMVGTAELLCSGCGQPYSPEPRPETEALRSNAGMGIDHGKLHGYTPGPHDPYTAARLKGQRDRRKAREALRKEMDRR